MRVALAERGLGDERDHRRPARPLLRRHDLVRRGDDADPDEQDGEQDRHHDQGVGGVLRLGRLERRARRWRSASTPVSATEPLANALSSSRIPIVCGAEVHRLVVRRRRAGVARR